MSKDSALPNPNPRFNNFHQINKPREQPVMIEIETPSGDTADLVVQGDRKGKPVLATTNELTGKSAFSGDTAEAISTAAVAGQAANSLLVHPRYHCHIMSRDVLSVDRRFPDASGAENHGVLGADLSAAVLNAAVGYLSTGMTAERGVSLPDVNFDWNAGEQLFIWWLHSMQPETSNRIALGNVNTTGPGFNLTITTDGTLSCALRGSSGANATGLLTTAGAVNVDGSQKDFGVFLDGKTKRYSSIVSGVFVRNGLAVTQNESTATAQNILFGRAPGQTMQIATRTRAFVMIKIGAQDPAVTKEQALSAVLRLRANPFKLLTKADLWGA